MDRSTRLFIAIGLILLALLFGINYAVEQRPIIDWWLPAVLVVAGIAVATLPRWRRPKAEAASDRPITGPASAYPVQEFTFDRSAQIAAPEQPGEVNVREPEDEVESAGVDAPIQVPGTGTPTPAGVTSGEPAPTPPETRGQAPAPDRPAPAVTLEEEAEIERAGQFAPPTGMDATLNPPTESDSVPGVVVNPTLGEIQTHDPARHEMPLSEVEPPVPDTTPAERVEKGETMLQPADTAENEFQSGEHVAANQPTTSAPIPTQTTGEGMGAGVEPMPPEQKEVLDATAASPDATSTASGANQPDVAERVLSGESTEADADALAPRDTIAPTAATEQAAGTAPDNLTALDGIGRKMADALRAAGIDSYVKLSQASDDDLRNALSSAGLTFAPSLATWREQAGFLARGDRAGFEALRQSLRASRKGSEGTGE